MVMPGMPGGVPSFDRGMLDEALKELKREHGKVVEAQRRASRTNGVATSRDRAVSVTVDGRGEVVQVMFKGTRYRSMPAAELGQLVTDTIAAARRKVFKELEGVMGPMMPVGLDVRGALTGDVDLDGLLDNLIGGADFFGAFGTERSSSPSPPSGKDGHDARQP